MEYKQGDKVMIQGKQYTIVHYNEFSVTAIDEESNAIITTPDQITETDA